MLVKALDENRVKILIEEKDIDFYNLPFEKLNYEEENSKAFIYELLEEAYEKTGLDFHDCKLMIEVIPGVARTYYVLFTKIDFESNEKIHFDKADRYESEMYIFKTERGRDVVLFFEKMREKPPQKSDIFFYNNAFYIVLNFSAFTACEEGFSTYIKQLEEYAKRCRFHLINEAVLREWGEHLLGPDAFFRFT